MLANEFRGKIVRITSGRGAGQENVVLVNDATTLTVTPPWIVTPDATSDFVVAEASWNFGTASASSPAVFEVPNYEGATVQISGRAANVHDRECPPELSPLTRYVVGGSAGSGDDAEVAGVPSFAIFAPGDGRVELVGIGFQSLLNTQSIAAGTLTAYFWNELSPPTLVRLSSPSDSSQTELNFAPAVSAVIDDLIQIDAEVVKVTAILDGGLRCEVLRGSHGSTASMHAEFAKVYPLEERIFIAPFPRNFFGSPASGSYSFSAALTKVRIAAAEFTVTNSRGPSEVMQKSFTSTVDGGLRTLSGGQFSIQIEGPLAIQTNAAPPLIMDAAQCVRDIFARVGEAPSSGPLELQLRQDSTVYCTLTIPEGDIQSNVIDGFGLPPLLDGSTIALDVLAVGQVGDTSPGRDLTVTIRL